MDIQTHLQISLLSITCSVCLHICIRFICIPLDVETLPLLLTARRFHAVYFTVRWQQQRIYSQSSSLTVSQLWGAGWWIRDELSHGDGGLFPWDVLESCNCMTDLESVLYRGAVKVLPPKNRMLVLCTTSWGRVGLVLSPQGHL